MTTAALRRTALYESHVAAGARIVPFAGWEMPVQYEGVIAEHLAVREAAGIFDVSHMGEIEVAGPQALDLLQLLVTNDLERLAVGGAQYGLLCREDGGVLDDCFTYRLAPERYLTVTNAANHERDLAWFAAHAGGFDVELTDRAGDYAMLAVQGPLARGLVEPLANGPLPARMAVAQLAVAGVPALVAGTGYTGEDGVEILLEPAGATSAWDALVAAGARPAGLAARDTLRTEVCYHLYGNDLSTERGPIEAGLGWCCREQTGFIGADAVRAAREHPPPEQLIAFRLTERGVPRPGDRVAGGGTVTSGTFSPSLEIGIGMAYVPRERAVPGETLELDQRGKIRAAVVAERPLYRRV
ncbi:MAG TPA: glycine cleavage system aminomethyltransferase GcvT [Solirubrobacteraceae bacterium]|nr:glycine cleavage system aminomethyltransferase GcvT [Solirubrobacteraceae bacterium]